MKEEGSTISIDTGKLCTWPIAQSINLAYTEAIVRLSNALNLHEYVSLPELHYRLTVGNPDTGEIRNVTYAGGETDDPVLLPFPVTISILAIIRLKDYTASYAERAVINLFFNSNGEGQRDGDMDRMFVLFEERPEFQMLELSGDLGGPYDDQGKEGEEEDQEETALPAPEEWQGGGEIRWRGLDEPIEDEDQPVRPPERPKFQ